MTPDLCRRRAAAKETGWGEASETSKAGMEMQLPLNGRSAPGKISTRARKEKLPTAKATSGFVILGL
jgi:hypothetical protein